MKPSVAIAGALSLTMACPAQQPPQDGWIWSWFNLGMVVADQNFGVIATPGHAAVGGPGYEYSVDSGWEIWELGPPLILRTFTPPQAPVLFAMATQGSYIAHDRRRVWMLGTNGMLGYIDKTTRTATSETPAGSAHGAWTSTEQVGSMCTNGRDLFFSIKVTANDPYHIFAIDTQASPITVRPVATMPVGSTDVVGPRLALGPDGDLLASYDYAMWSIGSETGSVQQLCPEPPFWVTWRGNKLIGYNPWTDELATTPRDVYNTQIYSRTVVQPGAWQLRVGLPNFFGSYALACVAERPFELFGKGCNNGTGRDPRLGWTGMPQLGGSFTIRLRDAEPSGFAVAWLGLSDTLWAPVGALPFDLAVQSAPGCRLLAAVDTVVFVPVDAQGRAVVTHAVPSMPALLGMDLFAQTLSSSTANGLGLVTSDALMIRIR